MSLWPPRVCKTDTHYLVKTGSKEYSSQNSNCSITACFSTVFTTFLPNNTSEISAVCNSSSDRMTAEQPAFANELQWESTAEEQREASQLSTNSNTRAQDTLSTRAPSLTAELCKQKGISSPCTERRQIRKRSMSWRAKRSWRGNGITMGKAGSSYSSTSWRWMEWRLKKGQELLAFKWHLERAMSRGTSVNNFRIGLYGFSSPLLALFKNKIFLTRSLRLAGQQDSRLLWLWGSKLLQFTGQRC